MGRKFGFIFDMLDGELEDSYMANEKQISEIPLYSLNPDNLAIRDEDGSWFRFVKGEFLGEGYYISNQGMMIKEWDLYEHMANEDDDRYDVMYGIEEDDEGNMTIIK